MRKISHFFLITLFLSFLIPFFSFAQTATSTDVQTVIQQLQEQIKTLQAQIISLQAELISTKEEISSIREELRLTRILRQGAAGDDVKQLQEFLKQFPDVYPEGLVTGYFGPLTEAAVKKFQEQQGIVTEGDASTTGFGQVGPKTIARLNEVSGIAPAIPATPAEPTGITGTTTVPAVPATPAQPATTTSTEFLCAKDSAYCATQKECAASGFFWYTVSCHPNPPPPQSCAASYIYCSATDCSANGWYWCRDSCYGYADACLGKTYIPPATSTSVPPPPPPSTTTTTTSTSATSTSTTNASDTTSPSTPTGLSATVTSSQIYLSWAAATDNVGVSGYQIYRGGIQISTATSTSYSDTGLTPNTSYTYAVTAYDAAGNVSLQSSVVAATTAIVTTAAASSFDFSLSNSGNMTVSPGASVSNTVTATLVSGTTQQVSFSIPHELEVSSLFTLTSTSCFPTCSTIVSYNAPSYSSVGSYYTVPVTVTGGGVTKTTSFIFTIGGIPQVQGLTAIVSGTSVALSWQDVTGTYSLAGSPNNMFGSYNIYRGSSADFTPQLNVNHIAQGSVLSYTDSSNLSAGTYYYKVALQDKNGVVGLASQAVSAVITSSSGSCTSLTATLANNKTAYVIGDTASVTYACPAGTAANFYGQIVWPDGRIFSGGAYTASPQMNLNYYLDSEHPLGIYTLRGCFDANCQTVAASLQFTLASSTTSSLDLRVKNLAAISQALVQLLKLLGQLKIMLQ